MSSDYNGTIPYKIYRGIKIPKSANKSYFDAACDYQPQKNDIFIVTYPKCGTTWVQHIVYLIFNEGRPARSALDIVSAIPFPEQDGFPHHNRFLALKYHLPLELMPLSGYSKYIYIVRNPMDTCVSYYHFLKNLPGYDISDMDSFFNGFLQGEVPYGDFFDHLISWSKSWHWPNLLFLTYESLKQNHKQSVKKIASFLEMEHIVHNDAILNDIVRYSRSDFMRTLVDESKFMRRYLKLTSSEENRNVFQDLGDDNTAGRFQGEESTKENTPAMIRKGCVGDWKGHFSVRQARTMKEEFARKTLGTPAEQLWKDVFADA